MHLLLLDDDDLNNEILLAVLQDIDLIKNISVYNDGWDALKFLENQKLSPTFPDILLVDLKMPTMDGEEFIQKYEASFFKIFPQSKLIILSNSTLGREKDRIMEYKSVVNFITKPVEADRLRDVLGSLI